MIIPPPVPNAPPPKDDLWVDASFFDVTLVQLCSALIASGKYAPGELLMKLAVAGTSQIMIQTGRWSGQDVAQMTLEEATNRVINWQGIAR